MAKTKISWATDSWNPFVGCSLASPACTNCYAMHQAARIIRMHRPRNYPSPYEGTIAQHKGGPVWTGQINQASEQARFAPLRWTKPRTIFVGSMSDFFHPTAPDAWRIEALAVAALTPQHQYLILTKRAADMRHFINNPATQKAVWTRAAELSIARNIKPKMLEQVTPGHWPLQNVALGVSAEDQKRADERVPELMATAAPQRFVSCEPLLGPVDLNKIDVGAWMLTYSKREPHPYDPIMVWPLLAPFEHFQSGYSSPGLDFVIAGGENDLGDRPTHPDWLRSLRDQCAAAGVKFHFKQWGKWAPRHALTAEQAEAHFDMLCKAVDRSGPYQRTTMVLTSDGRQFANSHSAQFMAEAAEDPSSVQMLRLGTAHTGRTLDGREHNDILGETPSLPSPLAGEGGARSATDEGTSPEGNAA